MNCALKHCKCRPVNYTDGTPSREVEDDDWEATGGEEMNRLYDKIVKKTPKYSVLDCRDTINNIRDLVDVCRMALLHDQTKEGNRVIADTLYFHVMDNLIKIEKELASL